MALQLSDKEKIKNSHFVINNNLDTQNLKKQFNEVFKKLI
jgi:dephospho-CoA kinase